MSGEQGQRIKRVHAHHGQRPGVSGAEPPYPDGVNPETARRRPAPLFAAAAARSCGMSPAISPAEVGSERHS